MRRSCMRQGILRRAILNAHLHRDRLAAWLRAEVGSLEMNFDGPDLTALQTAAAALFLAALLVLSLIDFRTQRLADKIVLPMLAAGLAVNAGTLFTSPLDAILGAILGYGSLRLLAALYSFRAPSAFGGGDLKLTAMMGAWLGASALPLVLLVAFVWALASHCPWSLPGSGD